MKTEITLENKAKFFAMYIGQRLDENFYHAILRGVFQKSIASTDWWINTQHLELPISDITLPLKPLSSISDEDAIQACEVAYNLSFTYGAKWITERDNEIGFITVKSKGSHHSFDLDFNNGIVDQYTDTFNRSENLMDHYAVCDYLRSKGYALPWMGLSVEEMVEAGWIKLQSE